MTDQNQELLDERNALARQLADLRDEMTSLRKELDDAQTTAVQWSQWAEENADRMNGPEFTHTRPDNYDTMLSEANVLMEKLKDHWYDVGYATALRELRHHWYDAMDAWAEQQGVGELFRSP